jgi:hypothetical protein
MNYFTRKTQDRCFIEQKVRYEIVLYLIWWWAFVTAVMNIRVP